MSKFEIRKISGQEFIEIRPIEFKEINIEEFLEKGYNISKYQIIPDDNGFVSDDVLSQIKIAKSSTDVLNLQTGSGKTTAIYQLVKKILDEDPNSIIIMASPFISLVGKDVNYLVDKYNIDPNLITNFKDLVDDVDKIYKNFNDISEYEDNLEYFEEQRQNCLSDVDNISEIIHDLETKIAELKNEESKLFFEFIFNKRIHAITINALLRNSGDAVFEQKIIKTNFFNKLFEYCKDRQAKVYLFLDEIHASIHNFKNEFIYYLLMWKGIIHKCIVSTATYTEPVNIVLKHLGYLTNDTINIFESNRIQQQKLSSLDMAFTSGNYSGDNIEELFSMIDEWLKKYVSIDNNFHILSYSKNLSKKLAGSLKEAGYANLQILTSNTYYKFEQGKNNIGTNFSTGIDIEKNGDLLVIIFPCKYDNETLRQGAGIFSSGLPSILQAVARLRSKGRILFLIPPMKSMIESTITIKLCGKIPMYNFNEITNLYGKTQLVNEDFLVDENARLENYINRKINPVSLEKSKYERDIEKNKTSGSETNITRPAIQFPNKYTIILERGQDYLVQNCYKSGKYITPYVVWAALHNQFINCSLDIIYFNDINTIIIEADNDNLNNIIAEHLNIYVKFSDNLSFEEYFELANIALKEVNEQSHHDTKSYTVILKIDGNIISNIDVQNIWIAISNSYYSHFKPGIQINSRTAYVSFMLNECESLKNTPHVLKGSLEIAYLKLKSICNELWVEINDKTYGPKEIQELTFFTSDVLSAIRNSIIVIKQDDYLIQKITKKGSFWAINMTDKNKLIKKFMDEFIVAEDVGYRKKRFTGMI